MELLFGRKSYSIVLIGFKRRRVLWDKEEEMLAKDASVVQWTGLGGQMDVAGGKRGNLSPAFKLGRLWEQTGEFLVGEAGLGVA